MIRADRTGRLPWGVDHCVSTGQTLDNIVSDLHRLLDENVAVAVPN